jgi:hypothetical protein
VDEAEHGLHDLLLERLLADDTVDDQVAGLILAAWESEDDLAAVSEGRPAAAYDPRTPPQREPQPDAYLAAVHVEGFRGIGEPATLPLRPGPGLTLVTGRNGSGKSSFAEAAELALTGDSGRWSGRTAVWKEGWRNLHAEGPTAVTVDLVTAGAPPRPHVRGAHVSAGRTLPGDRGDHDDGHPTRAQVRAPATW